MPRNESQFVRQKLLRSPRRERSSHERSNACSEQFDRAHQFRVWQGRDAHLESKAGDAAQGFVHVQDFFRDRFRIAHEERSGGAEQGVEVCTGDRWPAALPANVRKALRITGKEVVAVAAFSAT